MNTNILRIGNAQAFWGDRSGAACTLLQQQTDLDYLTLDYLSEVSMSILAIQHEKDPSLGYARDFLDVIRSLIPLWKQGCRTKLVTNAGGLNPEGCAKACLSILKEAGLDHKRIGVISGDDVFEILKHSQNAHKFNNLDTNEPLKSVQERLITANAYLGALPIAKSIQEGADIVITGRVADPSLTVGPCMANFAWSAQDYDKIAGATIAGHLIECGTQVTGGVSTNWLEIPDAADIGFPFVEMDKNGAFVITKPTHSGGAVTKETVKEQLLYEIGDPAHYLSPDATVSFLSLVLREEGSNRIHVSGAKGSAPPSAYKVSATYRDGYKAEGFLAIFGTNVKAKAKRCGDMILKRMQQMNCTPAHFNVEAIGCGSIIPSIVTSSVDPCECMLRIAVADSKIETLEYFAKEIAPLVTSGPQGITGYTSGRPHIRPVFGYWPCLIDVKHVHAKVEII